MAPAENEEEDEDATASEEDAVEEAAVPAGPYMAAAAAAPAAAPDRMDEDTIEPGTTTDEDDEAEPAPSDGSWALAPPAPCPGKAERPLMNCEEDGSDDARMPAAAANASEGADMPDQTEDKSGFLGKSLDGTNPTRRWEAPDLARFLLKRGEVGGEVRMALDEDARVSLRATRGRTLRKVAPL